MLKNFVLILIIIIKNLQFRVALLWKHCKAFVHCHGDKCSGDVCVNVAVNQRTKLTL